MSSDYSALDITRDAVAFADSQFGQHYLSRLESAKSRALDDAQNIELTGEFRNSRATQAATIQKEIDYFTTARTVAESPTLMKRLRDAAKRKGGNEPDIDL